METERSWLAAGRGLAWIMAGGFFAAAVIFALMEFDVTAPSLPASLPSDFVNRLEVIFQNEQARWPWEVASSLLFVVGFVGLAGVGLVLRETYGRRDAVSSFMSTSFVVAAILGIGGQLMFLGAKQVAIDPLLCDCVYEPEQIVSQGRALAIAESSFEWLLYAVFALSAIALFLAARLAVNRAVFSRGWASFSQVVAVVFLVGLVAAAIDLDMLSDLTVAIGAGILLPVWAIWLARQLGRKRAGRSTDRPPVPA
jgi:hypothetical protein